MPGNSTENILYYRSNCHRKIKYSKNISKKMSVAVMNVKAISHRAGEAALDFQPITDFVDEMAQDVM